MQGKPNPLNSSFKLTYYTLLNLLQRCESTGADAEYVIRNSFQQFQFDYQLPKQQSELDAVLAEANAIQAPGQDGISEYSNIMKVRKAEKGLEPKHAAKVC